MVDNRKMSFGAPGLIAGYVAIDPETGRWRCDIDDGILISVRADNITDALSQAAVAHQMMTLVRLSRKTRGYLQIIHDGLAELTDAISTDGALVVIIAGLVIDRDTTIDSLQNVDKLVELGSQKGASPEIWPAWPAGRAI